MEQGTRGVSWPVILLPFLFLVNMGWKTWSNLEILLIVLGFCRKAAEDADSYWRLILHLRRYEQPLFCSSAGFFGCFFGHEFSGQCSYTPWATLVFFLLWTGSLSVAPTMTRNRTAHPEETNKKIHHLPSGGTRLPLSRAHQNMQKAWLSSVALIWRNLPPLSACLYLLNEIQDLGSVPIPSVLFCYWLLTRC